MPRDSGDRETTWPWTCPRNIRKQATFLTLARDLRPFVRDYGMRRLDRFDVPEAIAIFRRYRPGVRTAVCRFMRDARFAGLITANPFAGLAIRAAPPRTSRPGFRIVTEEEFERLRGAARECGAGDYGLVLLAMLELMFETGARPGELFGLEHGAIDLQNDRAQIRQQASQEDGISTPKGGRSRWVPFAGAAKEAYLRAPQISERWAYPGPTGNHFVLQTFYPHWWKIRSRAGLDGFRLYELRHYALTRMLTARPDGLGLDIATVAEIAGHSDGGAMLMKYYAFIHQHKAIDRFLQADRRSESATSAATRPPRAPRVGTAASGRPREGSSPDPEEGDPAAPATHVRAAAPTVAGFTRLQAGPGGTVAPAGGLRRDQTWPWTHRRAVRKDGSLRSGAREIQRFVREYGARPIDSFSVIEATAIARRYPRDQIGWIRRLMNDARAEGVLGSNSFARLGIPERVPRVAVPGFQVITAAELDRLRQAIRAVADAGYGQTLLAMLELEAATGIRPGELFGLQRRDIDLPGEFAHVRRQIDRDGGLSQPSGARTRAIPFTGAARDAYVAAGRRSRVWAFPSPQGVAFRDASFSRQWWKIRSRAELPHVAFWDLRHHAIVRMVSDPPAGLGLDPASAAAVFGAGDGGRKIELQYAHIAQRRAVGEFLSAERGEDGMPQATDSGELEAAVEAWLTPPVPPWQRHMRFRRD